MLAVTRGAQFRNVDALAPNARSRELIPRGRPTVEIPVCLAALCRQPGHRRIAERWLRLAKKPARELVACEPRRFKTRPHIVADLVAAGADRWSGRDDEIGSAAAKLACKHFDSDNRHPRGQAAPACVRRRDGAGSRIRNQQRDAVGRLDRQRDIWLIRYGDVGIGTGGGLSNHGMRPVHLMEPGEMSGIRTNRGCDIQPRGSRVAVVRGSERPLTRRKEM